MTTLSSRLDGLSEVEELERIPLPYKTLYHTLVFKNEMPIDLLRERHQSGLQQLSTWIQAALGILVTVTESQQDQNQDEDEDEELELEIQDVVSGFGQYEPTIESSIEILLQLEDTITQRSSPNSSTLDYEQHHQQQPAQLSAEIVAVLEQWSRLRGIIGDLSGSIREHHRLRDGIQSVHSISEQTRQATGILEKCLRDISADRQRTSELALRDADSRNGSNVSLSSRDSASSLRDRSKSLGVDSNDMLELDSRLGLLSLQIDTLQKSYPECMKSSKALKTRARNSKQQEAGSIAEKKHLMHKLYRDLVRDWNILRTRKDQLWRDLEECDRWRTRIEKMATQIEAMLEPVEIFHKMCINLLGTLDGQASADELSTNTSQQSLTIHTLDITQSLQPSTSTLKGISFMASNEPVDLEMLWSTLQELDEKQTMVAPAIENMFWVQEGEIQHRSKTANVPPTTPTTAQTDPSPTPSSTLDQSPLYPNLAMLDRQRSLKNRWSNLKTSLDSVGSKLHAYHTLLKDKANQALIKKEETAEDKTLVGSGNSVDGNDWNSTITSSPTRRRSTTGAPQKSPSAAQISPNWNSSSRLLRAKLVQSISMDSSTVRKFLLVKSDKPVWNKPRPWCPSVSVSSPGVPGFPLQTSHWGYYLVSTSPTEESFGGLIATPAPMPVRSATPMPSKPTLPALKNNRPPFSPGGNRRYTAFNKPPPPVPRPTPSRSVSVAAGEFKNGGMSQMTPVYREAFDWTKTLRRSTSFSTSNQNNQGGKGGRSNVNTPATKWSASTKGLTMTPAQRRNSSASYQSSAWNSGNNHRNNNGNNNALSSQGKGGPQSISSGRRLSTSSSEEDGTVMGLPGAHHRQQGRRIKMSHQKNGSNGHGGLANLTDSSSSLDSMSNSSNDSFVGLHTYGSSMSSSVGARSPSPYAPMFGSSFSTARSSAALHSALLASMSSSSSASLRYSSSSLSGNESRQQDQQEKRHQQQIMKLGTSSASSWMSVNMNVDSGSILSALSFTVPTYSFDDDFGSLGGIEESIAAM
ncbi:hypothetical protein BGZ99_004525 [Dissophora globulifera]|uniref:Uncharacterized protein n=1 Tax=Dissophora globulifera TaxID=979702 RepID=A0A9P6UUM1_9FUNG|nr:hypothetical protein BGZ99_004525 [Dissophora globulifera]